MGYSIPAYGFNELFRLDSNDKRYECDINVTWFLLAIHRRSLLTTTFNNITPLSAL